jgi:hypothetical protein
MKQASGRGNSGISFDQLQTEIDAWQHTAGFRLMDFLTFSGALPQFLSWITRNRMVSLTQVCTFTGQNEETALALMGQLVDKGFLRQLDSLEGDASYRVRYVSKQSQQEERPVSQDLWQAVDREVTRLTPPVLNDDNPPSSGNL